MHYQKSDWNALLYFCHIFIVYILFVYILYLCENFAWNTDSCKYSLARCYSHVGCNYAEKHPEIYLPFCGELVGWWKGLKYSSHFTEPPWQLPAGVKRATLFDGVTGNQTSMNPLQSRHASIVDPRTITTGLFCELLCHYPMLLYPIRSLVSTSVSPSWRSWHRKVPHDFIWLASCMFWSSQLSWPQPQVAPGEV